MRFAHVLAAVLTLAGLSVARAQDVFETVSGNTYEGTVVSNDGTSVEITTTDGMTMKLPYESLTPMTKYRLRAGDAKDAKGQLALADWCMKEKLYEQAKGAFRKALELDPAMADDIKAQVVVARKTAADELLARGKSLQAEKKYQEARHVFALIVQELPLEPAAKEASKMLAEETTARKESALKRSPKSKDAAPAPDVPTRADGEPFSAETVALFKPIIDSYHKMLDATQEGLAKSGTSGTKEYEKAISEGENIRKAAAKLKPQAASNPEIAEALELVDSKLEEALVDARVNLANDYMLRTSYPNATDVVNKGLAEYPKNERLLATRAQVVSASSSNGGDWVIGGRLR
jgi:tetratricopeptide (TPR) repeat protein